MAWVPRQPSSSFSVGSRLESAPTLSKGMKGGRLLFIQCLMHPLVRRLRRRVWPSVQLNGAVPQIRFGGHFDVHHRLGLKEVQYKLDRSLCQSSVFRGDGPR